MRLNRKDSKFEAIRLGQLQNGLSYALWPDSRDAVATLQIWVSVGSRDEAHGKTGLAHMLEHLMFRGSATVPDGEFDRRMESLGAAFLATGHYARIEEREGRFALLRGRDSIKDQSYFLFGLRRASLARIRFPLGEMTKPEVRLLAQEMGVPTALKRESQDICFVGSGDYAQFVQQVKGLVAWVIFVVGASMLVAAVLK
jgi:hypothetical protein